MGHQRTRPPRNLTSASPLSTDIIKHERHVGKVPANTGHSCRCNAPRSRSTFLHWTWDRLILQAGQNDTSCIDVGFCGALLLQTEPSG